MKNSEPQIRSPESPETQMFISMMSNTHYFDKRFEKMQSQVDNIHENQVITQSKLDKLSANQDLMQTQMDNFREQLRDYKYDMDRRFNENRNDMLDRFSQVDKRFEQVDKRFEQVDKRFDQMDQRFVQIDKRLEQIIFSIEKNSEKMDYRDERQRTFTLRMFIIAISFSSLSFVGILLKVFNVV
ncbi:hypothetical protein MHK_010317 [Candidatus Magnetomorum sp. HK-1]|nr:hypothetical protein MHK_010317 [Candidatus Magnetomorum sp. HK-1]